MTRKRDADPSEEDHVLVVRQGHGANCSSVGSVVDTLFLGAVASGVVLAIVAAALKRERVTVVGEPKGEEAPKPAKNEDDDAPAP